MATRRTSLRALARPAAAAAAAAALVACGCETSTVQDLVQRAKRFTGRAEAPAPPPPPAPEPAQVATIVIVAPAPRDPSTPLTLELTGERRYAGGRPIRWWADRLTRLRQEGPRELYDLTLARARLCGLTVEERAAGDVTVTVPAAPTAGAAVPRPEARR